MKKVFMMAFVAASLMFASCGNKSESANTNADSTEVADSAHADSTKSAAVASDDVEQLAGQLTQQLNAKDANALTALLVSAKEKAAELAKNDPEKAKAYVSYLQNWIKSNASTIKTMVSTAGDDAVTKAVSTAIGAVTTIDPSDVVNSIASAAESDARGAGAQLLENAKEGVANAVKDSKVGEAATKAADAAEKAKAAKEAVENAPAAAKKAAKDAANKAVEKASKKAEEDANKANKKVNEAVNNAAGKALKGLGL